MNDMKKLLLEFRKNVLKEQEEMTTKYDDAIAVIKTFMQFPAEPGTPQAELNSELQNALNFAEQYNKSPGLKLGTPQEDVIAQRKISNKFVQQQIQDILSKMGIDVSRISDFIQYLNQTAKTPEAMAQADIEMSSAEEKDSEAEKDGFEIDSGDITPPQQGKTSAPKYRQNKFKAVSGKVT